MACKRHKAEEIVNKLRQADVDLAPISWTPKLARMLARRVFHGQSIEMGQAPTSFLHARVQSRGRSALPTRGSHDLPHRV